jgi:phospholipid/cholesterol/gamma-HCH transport system ATP-binding protein
LGVILDKMISLSEIKLNIDGDQILEGVSFSLKKGEIAALLGPSGAGKSSILKIILGLWKPDSGSVVIDGVDISKLTEKEILPLRSKTGVVFQGDALFDSLNVEENVGYFLNEHTNLEKQEVSKRVKEVLSFVNLNGTENLYPEELSGGMKKRVAIARALAFNPDIILYDEPTTGLDPINSQSILNLIKRTKDRCATSIVITHDVNDAVSIGDYLILVNEGKIVESGTVKQILYSEKPFVHDFFYEVYQDADLLRDKNVEFYPGQVNG